MKKLYVLSVVGCLALNLFSARLFAQGSKGSVKGQVTTIDGKAAPLVSVSIEHTNLGDNTNAKGLYQIHNIKTGDYILKISAVGITVQQQNIHVTGGETLNVDFIVQETASELSDVIVNANRYHYAPESSDDVAKMPLKNLENPQVYSTVTSALMVDQGAYSLDDAMKNVPGASRLWASTDRAGFGNGTAFALRGFELNSYMRNGIPTNVGTTIDNANIERVEVLKGPSATLFGSTVTAYGGLINRVTKKPFDSTGGSVSYAGGSYGFNRMTVDYNTPLNKEKTALFRINGAYNTQNSWQDNGFHNSFFLSPSFFFKINDRLTLSFDAEFYKSTGTTPQIFFFNTSVADLGVSSADKLNLDYNRSYISNDLQLNSTNVNFSGQMDYKISDNWRSQTNVAVTHTSSYGPMPYFYLLPGNQQISRMVWTIDGQDHSMDIQQNFIGNFTIGKVKNRIVAGLDFFNYNVNVGYHEFEGTYGGATAADLFDIINTTGNIPNYLNFNKAKVDSAYASSPAASPYINIGKQYVGAAYVSDVVNLTDKLIANVAVRVDYFDNKGNFDPVSGLTTGGFHQAAVSPKFGLVYQIIKNKVSVFGNYLNGFTNESGKDFNDNHFKPEQANQWEAGLKLNAFSGRLSGTLSYYDIQVKDILRTDPDHPNFQIQNGTQLSRGFEGEIITSPLAGLNVVAGYAHNVGKYVNASDDVNGKRPGSSGPEDMANLWLDYRLRKGAAKGLGIGFGGNYAGTNIIVNSVSQGTFTAPSYTVLNSTLYFDRPRFRLGVSVNNLADKKYWTGWTTVNPQQPRSISATATFKF